MRLISKIIFSSIENIMVECGVNQKYADFFTYKLQWILIGFLLLEMIGALFINELFEISLSDLAQKHEIPEGILMLPFWLIIAYPMLLIFVVLPILKIMNKVKG